jgi:hypothetical protein
MNLLWILKVSKRFELPCKLKWNFKLNSVHRPKFSLWPRTRAKPVRLAAEKAAHPGPAEMASWPTAQRPGKAWACPKQAAAGCGGSLTGRGFSCGLRREDLQGATDMPSKVSQMVTPQSSGATTGQASSPVEALLQRGQDAGWPPTTPPRSLRARGG